VRNNEIRVVEDFLTKDECFHILNRCKEDISLSVAGTIGGNPNERKSSVGWVNDLGDVNQKLKDILKDSFIINGMEVTGLGPFQFTEYKVGEFYGWHTDRDSTTFMDRFTSTVIQLNDDYTGGVLEIKNPKGELVPINNKVGTLYIFDSNLRHRVTPVEDGVRYSLVNWVSIIKTNSSQQNLI
jgi:predicted 2-oxoglutarate/Fe(II)-dependent dioxygenase YbiX